MLPLYQKLKIYNKNYTKLKSPLQISGVGGKVKIMKLRRIIMSGIKIEGIISETQLAVKLKEMKGSDKIILETTVDNLKELINYDEVIREEEINQFNEQYYSELDPEELARTGFYDE